MTTRSTSDAHARLLRRATGAAVCTATALAVFKLVAWLLSGSVALLASAIDSALDIGASLINALAVRYALKPPDDDHRFGHGKSEALAGLAQALLIGGSAAFVMTHAVDRFRHPRQLDALWQGIAVMIVATIATVVLVSYQRDVVRATGSQAIQADALHFVSDIATSLGTIAALALARFGLVGADPLLGMVIALGTAYGAVRIGWETYHVLMDHELPAEVQQQIQCIATSHPEVRGLHDLRTRRSGPTVVIQFHLEMDGNLSLREANRISHEVATSIRTAFPNADVIIHQDPAHDVGAPS